MSQRRRVRVEDLIGRKVRTIDGARVIGRIEEIRAEKRGPSYEVTSYLLGPTALLRRLGIVHRLRGFSRPMHVVRWDQLSIGLGLSLRLNCQRDELTTE